MIIKITIYLRDYLWLLILITKSFWIIISVVGPNKDIIYKFHRSKTENNNVTWISLMIDKDVA